MRIAGRVAVLCVCWALSVAVPTAVGAEAVSPLGGVGGSALESPLVVPEAQSLLGAEGVGAVEEARRDNPEAVQEREASETRFEGLDAQQAESVAAEGFPKIVDEQAGGVPPLPAGAKVTGYPSDVAASVELPGGQTGVVEALQPIALEGGSGRRVPIDLHPQPTSGGYAPASSLVGLSLPRRVGDGIVVSSVGVSLTPVDRSGAALEGSEGAVEGAVVLYANTGTDMDSLVKPTTLGFQAETVLRSINSPRELYFRVGLPDGAHLEQEPEDGSVQVVDEGAVVATVRPPDAVDDVGTIVPTSMSVSGNTLTVTVDEQPGEYQYPVEVDPEVEASDPHLTEYSGNRSNWTFETSSKNFKGEANTSSEYLKINGENHSTGEAAFWGYQTQGVSHIWEFSSESEARNKGAGIEAYLELDGSGGKEEKLVLSAEALGTSEYTRKVDEVICPAKHCVTSSGAAGNAIHFELAPTKSQEGKAFSDFLYKGDVLISEPAGTHSTTGYNTSSPTLELEVEREGKKEKQVRANALYASAPGWLSEYAGALEPIAEDKGIGVSATRLEYESAPGTWESLVEHNYLSEHKCKGIQCYDPTHSEDWTLNPKLANGEDKIRYRAEEAAGGTQSGETEGVATVKVDKTPPHGLHINGLPFGNELSERPYVLTVSATDGEGSTIASSGVKTIELYVDGKSLQDKELRNKEFKEVGKKEGECGTAKGECPASAEYTINGAELGAGHHAIVIVTKDNAGNEARHPEQITIRHSTPIPMGPGSVDLQSGDLSMGSTDVSMGNGLAVSRNYSSRATTQGDEGPLGPEWTMSLGTSESLTEMVDGSMLLTDSTGQQTIFAKTETTTYESPPGNSNLKLTVEENEAKQKIAYYLENVAAHTKDKFTLPAGDAKTWVPTRQEGAVPTDTVSYTYQTLSSLNEYPLPANSDPEQIVSGPEGALWFTDEETNKIGTITTTGSVTEYPLPEKSHPNGITNGPEGAVWFTECRVSETHCKIGKMTSRGVVTEYALAEGHTPDLIALGPDGNLWFTEWSYNGSVHGSRIGKITPAGTITEYALPSETSGPWGITPGPDGNLWFAEHFAHRIGRITPSGSITEFNVGSNREPTAIVSGPEGDLWAAAGQSESGGIPAVEKITTAGTVTEYPLPTGSDPGEIADGPDGDLWFTEHEGTKVAKMTPSGSVTEYTAAQHAGAITAGPDGEVWFTEPLASKIGSMTTSGVVTVPSEALAPVPAGVECPKEHLQPGCRVLKFKYAHETTAHGEGPSEWGSYNNRLEQVLYMAYNPATKKVEEPGVPVAEYRWDPLGRLRAEWDPRLPSPLKTQYGYDEYGHMTAVDPPGREAWTLSYGTAAGDLGSGRLLKITRGNASLGLWNGESVGNTERPQVSGTAVLGTRLAVSNGKWSGNPLTYSYQWEDCTLAGACTPIIGATNANYTLAAKDTGEKVMAVVTATNGGGAETVASAPTAEVGVGAMSEYTTSMSYPGFLTAGPDGNIWATSIGAVVKSTPAGEQTTYTKLPERMHYLGSIVPGPAKEAALWFTGSNGSSDAIGKVTTGGTFSEYALPNSSGPSAITDGPESEKALWFTLTSTSKVGKITTSGAMSEYSLGAGTEPRGIAAAAGALWVIEGNNTPKIAKVTTSGTVAAEYALPQESGPSEIVSGPPGENALWFTESRANRIGRITTTGEITEYQLPAGSHPFGIAAGPEGDMWFTDMESAKIGKITPAGVIAESAVPSGIEPGGIAAGPSSEKALWFAEAAPSGRLGKANVGPQTEGEAKTPGAGTTIDYEVPLEGSSAPHQMGVNETTHKPEPEKWGQSDDPVEATAIFPADEPQGWPASGYKRATVYYLDEQGRGVNVASPSSSSYGDIATTEYNEFNDVTRTLTGDNRATALAAGEEHSVEVSKLLDTENHYNEPECQNEQPGEVAEMGTRLCETLGPQHEIKYVAGKEQKEALGRYHEEFFYDQGVPKEKPYSEETYDLVTETSGLALLANREDVEVRTTKTSYSGQNNLGWKLREPTSVTVDPRSKEANPHGLNLTTTTMYNKTTGQVEETRGAAAERTLTFSKEWGARGSEPGQLKSPWGIAVDSKGDIWVSDLGNNRIEEFSPEGTFLAKIGELGSGSGQLKSPGGIAFDAKGDLWIADTGNSRIAEYNPAESKWLPSIGSLGSEKGKLKEPTAIAFDSKGNLWVADSGNNRVEKFNVTEGKATSEFGSLGSEPGKLDEPKGIAIDVEGNIWVSDKVNNRLQKFSAEGVLKAHFGTEGTEEGQLSSPLGLAMDASGEVWVADRLNNRAEAFSTATGGYVGQAGWKGTGNGQMIEPRSIAFDANGNMWIVDSLNNRIDEYSPGPNAHDEKTIYYSGEPNETYKECGKHGEWAGLPCMTLPAKQPELDSLPKLPETTIAKYNMWLEPETIEETFGSAKRTKKEEYDPAGRLVHSESSATGTTDKSLPPVSITYNSETGATEKQTTSVEGKELTTVTEDNRLGQIIKYSDSAGNTASYKYAGPENDYLLEEVSDSHMETKEGKEQKSYQRYYYEETTKTMNKLEDSAAGTFTATHDAEGNLATELYPNNMSACYTRNSIGEDTSVQYIKGTNCSESEPAVFFSDSRMASIHGALMSQTSTLAKETYSYDPAERLTEAQEEPAGEGCTTRAYAYDEEGNRASLATRKPGSKNECVTEGGTPEAHNYDEANHLADSGIVYEPFGNVTTLPAADSEGHELTTSFYVDGAVATQTESGTTHEYKLDPEGRITETVTGTKKLISHYDASGEAITWTSEEEGKKTTRNIPGIDGTLAAIQTNNELPELQLHDLQGNIIATIGDSTSESKLKTTYNSTEFGAPNAGKAPPKYAWLGAGDVADASTTGLITYGATSYVPQTGRTLQSEQVAPPGLPYGSGAGAPVTFEMEPWNMQDALHSADEAPGLEAAREREAATAACAEHPEICETAMGAEGEYDPPGLASYNTTQKRAEQLAKDAGNTQLLGEILSLVPRVGEYIHGGADVWANLLAVSASSLAGCASARNISGRQWQWGACFINETRVGFVVGSVPIMATAELCTYERTNRHGMKEFYCLQSERHHVTGPWYE
jgi:streptogramin lyase